MTDIDFGYTPQPKQEQLHKSVANEVLFGGAAGPGKSFALRFEALVWAMRIPGIQVYLFRRTYPELEKNHILPSREIYPKGLGEYKSGDRRWQFKNGSMIHFCHCQHDSDVFNYQGAEIDLLIIDELTTFTEFQYDYLRGRVRSTRDIPQEYKHKIPGIICASNPGGVGHQFCKERWVDFIGGAGVKKAAKRQGGMLREYIPAKLSDNKILEERDPDYIHRLDALPEPYRTAYMEGDWDIFIGQAFSFTRMHHVVKPLPIPDYAPLYMTFDWGYGAPFALLWFWVDADNRIYAFAEDYGWNGTPNQGLRLTDSQIAERIKQKEERMGIWGRDIRRLAGKDSFSKKPDYMGGGQGPSTAEVFSNHGIYIAPGDPSRILKIRQVHERLRLFDDMAPMLQVYDICEQVIRTIPLLQADDANPEDIDSHSEDHCLTGDTLVDTDMGQVPIRNLVGTSGNLLTAGGFFTEYRNCRRTRRNAEILKITFDDGRSVSCTPDHKFLMNNGTWVQGMDLTKDSQTCISIPNGKYLSGGMPWKSTLSAKQPKSLMGFDIGEEAHITDAKGNGFIVLYGNTIMGRFQMVGRYIILTMINSTTRLKTWISKTEENTCRIIQNFGTIPHGRRLCVEGPPSGMAALKALNGIRNTMKISNIFCMIKPMGMYASDAGRNISVKSAGSIALSNARKRNFTSEICDHRNGNVSFAGKNSLQTEDRINGLVHRLAGVTSHGELVRSRIKRFVKLGNTIKSVNGAEKSLKALAIQNTALENVKENTSMRGIRIKRIESVQNQDVYCLNVDATHAFSVCGGVLVHNCYDCIALMAMARPMSMDNPMKRKSAVDKRIDSLVNPTIAGDFETYAAKVSEEAMTNLDGGMADFGVEEEYEDYGYGEDGDISMDDGTLVEVIGC